jgi:prolyl-tRNA editing enzyme YbaK/EbsC (Cys-tRNA(Pro) deacylase)
MVVPRKILKISEKPNGLKQPRHNIKTEIEEIKVETNNKKTTKVKEPLSLRRDVVYKTLIRSIKRYLTDKCNLPIDGF